MSGTEHTRPRARVWRGARRALATVTAAGCGVIAATAGAWALWADGAPITGGSVIAGDLKLTAGTPTWEQITPEATNPASGDLTGTPAGFYTMPGDVIEITQPVTTFLRGDNLIGGLTVDYADPGAVQGDIAASFRIEDAAGVTVAPADGDAQFGALVQVPGLVGDNDGQTGEWNVVITVRVLGEYDWTDQAATSNPATWAAGNLDISLKQVREGQGFTEVSP